MKYKKDFPIFENNPDLIYLDSAATTQLPSRVINSIKDFHENSNANIHRGIYQISEKATKAYEQARKIIADFINADVREIIFTSGTTDGINKLSRSLIPMFKNKNEIILTDIEHHSNIVPWQESNLKVKYIKLTKNLELDYADLKKKINKKTAIVSITHISNSLGTINDIKKVVKLAHKYNALVILDAAQSIARTKIDVRNLDVDFIVFSGHKAYSPMGIGVIYGKKKLLDKIPAFNLGGDMIDTVTKEKSTYAKEIRKFEAGTPNISGAIALAEGINYINKIRIKNIENQEKKLTKYALSELKKIKGIKIYSPKNSLGIISFNIKGIHPHDVAQILSDNNIAVRAGHHCNMVLMKELKIPGTVRISLGIYNAKEDIDKLINGIKKAQEVFDK
tara:strand:- start:48 stop:1226 length:1179 start_codon:yes stop_codon:yes gene_type:complete